MQWLRKYDSTRTSFHFPIAHCDFETGTCGWIQDTTDDFDWLRHSNNTGSFGTGPVGDHTTGAGTGRSRPFKWREHEILTCHSYELNFLIESTCSWSCFIVCFTEWHQVFLQPCTCTWHLCSCIFFRRRIFFFFQLG